MLGRVAVSSDTLSRHGRLASQKRHSKFGGICGIIARGTGPTLLGGSEVT